MSKATTTTKPRRRRKGGRRTVMTKQTAQKICKFVAAGLPLQHSAVLAGICKSSFHNWQNVNPEFAEAVEQAKAKGINARLKKIEAASATDWRAAAWLLEHCTPEIYAKSRLELTGANGLPLAATIGIYLPQKDAPEAKPVPAMITTSPHE